MPFAARRSFVVFAAFAVLVAFPCWSSTVPFATHSSDLQREVQRVPPAGAGLAVLFEQTDCPACAELRQTVLLQAGAAVSLKRWRTTAVLLDAPQAIVGPRGATQTPLALARATGVLGTPAIAFFDRDGGLLYRYQGRLRDARDLDLLTRYVTARRFEAQPFSAYLRQQRGPAREAPRTTHH